MLGLVARKKYSCGKNKLLFIVILGSLFERKLVPPAKYQIYIPSVPGTYILDILFPDQYQ